MCLAPEVLNHQQGESQAQQEETLCAGLPAGREFRHAVLEVVSCALKDKIKGGVQEPSFVVLPGIIFFLLAYENAKNDRDLGVNFW